MLTSTHPKMSKIWTVFLKKKEKVIFSLRYTSDGLEIKAKRAHQSVSLYGAKRQGSLSKNESRSSNQAETKRYLSMQFQAKIEQNRISL